VTADLELSTLRACSASPVSQQDQPCPLHIVNPERLPASGISTSHGGDYTACEFAELPVLMSRLVHHCRASRHNIAPGRAQRIDPPDDFALTSSFATTSFGLGRKAARAPYRLSLVSLLRQRTLR
jgi:hypothetical protein